MDLALGEADGTPIVLASYRNVSEYHGAQVREGAMIVRTDDAVRIGEIKMPAGSVCVDPAGRLWSADVAGHVACYDLRGRKQFDVGGSPQPAVANAKLPAASPLPVVVRADDQGTVWALFTLGRKMVRLDAQGAASEPVPLPEAAGAIFRLGLTTAGPVAIGDKVLWRP